MLFGDYIVAQGLIDRKGLMAARELSEKWGSQVRHTLLKTGALSPEACRRALSRFHGLKFVDLDGNPDESLFDYRDVDDYCRNVYLPWRKVGPYLLIVTPDPSEAIYKYLQSKYGRNIQLLIADKRIILKKIQSLAGESLQRRAILDLDLHDPQCSARRCITWKQWVLGYIFMSFFVLLTMSFPVPTLFASNALITTFIFLIFMARMLFIWKGTADIKDHVFRDEIKALDESKLPIFSILIPMYKEAKVLPGIVDAIRGLDYPKTRLDVKLVLEEHDTETIQAAESMQLEDMFEIIVVPPCEPKTKPKACNYALAFARGDYVTIYDAEDRPDPDQLKKVVVAFERSPLNTVCVQCHLNFYNHSENWMTRMFALEYSLWFDYFLPGMSRLGIPVPLGGTSNHFRTDVLQSLRAWDPFNVTEDADLGLRLAAKGYRVQLVESTTLEEANVRFGNWIRQRSRWLKGFMQTWLVHMREPSRCYRRIGGRAFWGCHQLFIGGTFIAALAFPVMWSLYLLWLATDTLVLDPFFSGLVGYLALFNLLLGNGLLIYITMLAALRRGYYRLAPFALTAPVYWGMISIAAYKALWQLIHKPHHWEKTLHGITRHHGRNV